MSSDSEKSPDWQSVFPTCSSSERGVAGRLTLDVEYLNLFLETPVREACWVVRGLLRGGREGRLHGAGLLYSVSLRDPVKTLQ